MQISQGHTNYRRKYIEGRKEGADGQRGDGGEKLGRNRDERDGEEVG